MSGTTRSPASRVDDDAGTGTPRKGFALPMSILALALLTAAVIAAYTATTAEVYINNAQRAQDRAYEIAETGLQQFLLRRGEKGFCSNCSNNPQTADSEWTKVSITGGYATVVSKRVRGTSSSGAPPLFFIRSTGVDTTVKLSGAGITTTAQRTVGVYATWGTATIKAIAALSSLSGITNNSNNSVTALAGDDVCQQAGDVAGAAVAKGGEFRGTGRAPTGSVSVDSSMTLDSLKRRVGVDWAAIVQYDAIPADYTIPADAWPKNNDFQSYPVVRVKTNNYEIPANGKGILIADSNLVISGNDNWDGIILVGGTLTASGTGTIEGAVITGLNRLLAGNTDAGAGTTTDNDVLSFRNRFRFNSCTAESAAERLNVYFTWTNTWMDNIAIW